MSTAKPSAVGLTRKWETEVTKSRFSLEVMTESAFFSKCQAEKCAYRVILFDFMNYFDYNFS